MEIGRRWGSQNPRSRRKTLGKVVQNKKLYTRDVAPAIKNTVEKRNNPTSHKFETAEVIKTVTITVTGTIWAYRPKSK
jgi:hypothetical protein